MLSVISDISKSTRGDVSLPFAWYLTSVARAFSLWLLAICHLLVVSEVSSGRYCLISILDMKSVKVYVSWRFRDHP
jgi:hypothetical protein